MEDKKEVSKKIENIRMLNSFLIQYFHIVAIVIVVAFVLLSFIFILKPKYDAIQTGIDISNDNMELEREALEKYNFRLDGYISSFDKIKKKSKDRLSILLPNEDFKENLFIQFEDMAKEQGLLMTSLNIVTTDVESILNPKPNTKPIDSKNSSTLPEGVGVVTINMNITGLDYEGFKEYLKDIESNLRIMDINNIAYSNEAKTLSLSISTYFNYFDRLNK